MSFLSNIKLPWQAKKNDNFDQWPEMVIIKREFFEDLVEKEVICRFLHDMNQGMNGTLHMPANWLINARPAIEECMKLILNELNENATPLNDKIKILGLKIADGEIIGEVKA